MPNPNPTPTRRTQAERRAETSAKLIEATIAILSEHGYAQTSVKAICERAGLSHGALFGRFATRLDLVVAAAAEVSRRQVDTFIEHVTHLPDTDDLAVVLPLLRETSRAAINAVWAELLIAARTDPELRGHLAPVSADYARAMLDASERVPTMRRIPEDLRAGLVAVIINQFSGDALARLPFPSDEADNRTMEVLVAMLSTYRDSLL
ncbi:TetR/AcrR family transcriptional regulator [Nocardia sp. NPDC051832]|uniref:TetR/AcrR family transcriptional regulator n=1 Tax=Nocardia sp. NPDC051832 TaxID=3155673 RepID=UPI00344AB17F